MKSKARKIERRRRLYNLVQAVRRRAQWGVINYGHADPLELMPFTHDTIIDGKGVRIMFTRDAGHHTGGWFKNPDYERCWHLSISFRSPDGMSLLPQDHKIALELVALLFGENKPLLWIEAPFSKEGKALDVWHYRLFCDEHWQPIMPRKEVYTKDFTERGWRSFSEIHDCKPNIAMEA